MGGRGKYSTNYFSGLQNGINRSMLAEFPSYKLANEIRSGRLKPGDTITDKGVLADLTSGSSSDKSSMGNVHLKITREDGAENDPNKSHLVIDDAFANSNGEIVINATLKSNKPPKPQKEKPMKAKLGVFPESQSFDNFPTGQTGTNWLANNPWGKNNTYYDERSSVGFYQNAWGHWGEPNMHANFMNDVFRKGINLDTLNPDTAHLTDKQRNEVKQNISNLDKLMGKSKTPLKLKVARGVRGAFADQLSKQIESGQLTPGATITDKGYMSTSLSMSISNGYANNEDESKHQSITFGINVPKGYRAVNTQVMSQYDNEAEVLLDRGTSMKIASIKKTDYGYHIETNVIPKSRKKK
jgi:hypothetical protein